MRPLLLPLVALALLACTGSGEPPAPADVAVDVNQVGLDVLANAPVIVLREADGERELPIWIGVAEARSIAQRLEEIQLPRPNTHDMARRLVEGLDATVERVTVTDLRQGTYYAVITLRSNGRQIQIDSRPSDAIALALRLDAPVFVREPLFEEGSPDRDPDSEPANEPAEEQRAGVGRGWASAAVERWIPKGIA